jgi:hypothetical protein
VRVTDTLTRPAHVPRNADSTACCLVSPWCMWHEVRPSAPERSSCGGPGGGPPRWSGRAPACRESLSYRARSRRRPFALDSTQTERGDTVATANPRACTHTRYPECVSFYVRSVRREPSRCRCPLQLLLTGCWQTSPPGRTTHGPRQADGVIFLLYNQRYSSLASSLSRMVLRRSGCAKSFSFTSVACVTRSSHSPRICHHARDPPRNAHRASTAPRCPLGSRGLDSAAAQQMHTQTSPDTSVLVSMATCSGSWPA